MKNELMRKSRPRRSSGERDTRAEYDFAGGVRGKYVDQYRQGTNIVVLEPEVAQAFPDSKSVNEALRGLLIIAGRMRGHSGR